jgi:hypothetical protein
MPNIYPYIDNGSWESYGTGIEIYNRAPQSAQQVCQSQRSLDLAYAGIASGKITFLAFPSGQPWNCPNAFFPLTDWFTGSSTLRPRTGISIAVSTRYKITLRVRTPSSAPIGSDDVPIFIAPYITKWAFPTSAATGTRRAPLSGSSLPITPVFIGTTVGACKDNWVEISYEFTTRSSPYASNDITPITNLAVFAADSAMTGAVLTLGVHDPIVEAGTVNVNGLLYIDSVSVDNVSFVCDLAAGTPSYTKTDETNTDADDGTATINATSSYTIEYSKDNVTWQFSNVFNALEPGTYTFYLRDSNGCTLTIPNVTILEYDAPDPPDPPVSGPLIINQMPVNKGNYISWFSSAGEAGFTSYEFTNCFWDLPKGYRVNKLKNRKHYPCVVNGERFSFYINFNADFSYPNFSSLKLYLINQYGSIQSNIATLERVFQDDNVNYFIYASVTLTGVNVGKYRLAIVDESNDLAISYVSNEIEVIEQSEADALTGRFRYRNSSTVFRFLYEKITTYYHEIRLRVNILEERTDGKVEQYREVTTGIMRNTSFELDLFYVIETYFFDDLAHRATFVFQIHDIMLINDRLMILKTQYNPEWINTREVCKGKIELWEQDFSAANRYGDPDVVIISDPFLLGDNGGAIKL